MHANGHKWTLPKAKHTEVYSGQHTKINKDTDMILNVNDHRNEYTHVETRHVFGYIAVQLNSVVLVK